MNTKLDDFTGAAGGGATAGAAVGASEETGTLSPHCGHGVRRAGGTSASVNADRQNGHVTETDISKPQRGKVFAASESEPGTQARSRSPRRPEPDSPHLDR